MADRPPPSDTEVALEPVASTDQTAVGLEPVAEAPSDTAQTAVGLAPVPRAPFSAWAPLGAGLAILVLGLGLYLFDSTGDGAPGAAELILTSNPGGATVRVDGRILARRTPLRLADLDPDRPHVVVVELPGYQRWTRHLKLTPATPEKLHAVLQPEKP